MAKCRIEVIWYLVLALKPRRENPRWGGSRRAIVRP